jgi:carbamoyltransferase
MITWGIAANSHDGSLAVFDNDELVFASHAERFSGLKNDPHLNKPLLNYARQWGEPNEVVWYEKPLTKTMRQLYAGQGWNWNENNIKSYLKQFDINAPLSYSNHHQSHAAAGYYTSGYQDATIVVLDSIGEWETYTIWEGKGDKLTKVFSQEYPHSIGLWYSAMTQRIGLTPNEDEYILMGMSAYGDGNKLYHSMKETFFELGPHDHWKFPEVKFLKNLHRGCKDYKAGLTKWTDKLNIAATTQTIYEEILLGILEYCSNKYKSRNLVLMGGCALNCRANGRASAYYDNIWIMPNPGDAGSSVGAVLARKGKHIKWAGPYLGYDIEGDYPVDELFRELKDTGMVGVANGRAEFGPRALGNRSLLADPRGKDMKDKVNKIKKRQKYRPFAPVILAEHAEKYFYGDVGPYMQYTSKCRKTEEFPAIVHVDGTSRVQTVTKKDNPGLRELLERWYAKTGCPMLLNTSLNIKGKPMVNDEKDAKKFAHKYGVSVY